MESNKTEAFRRTIIKRIAKCLIGDFERGKRVAGYNIPRKLNDIDLVIDFDLSQLSKAVEFELIAIASSHANRALRTDYRVQLNTINGICHFIAHARCT